MPFSNKSMTMWWKNTYAKIKKIPFAIKASIISLTIILILFCIYEWPFTSFISRYDGISIELYGFAFDILLFGLLIGIVSRKNEKKREIQELKNELTYIRGWHEEEAAFRLRNILKRLFEKGVQIGLDDIQESYINFPLLRTMEGTGLRLFNKVIFEYFYFNKIDFYNEPTDLSNSEFSNCSFYNTDFKLSNFKNTKFQECSFINCKFSCQNYHRINIWSSLFENCIFYEGKLHEISFINVNIINTRYIYDDDEVSPKIMEEGWTKEMYTGTIPDFMEEITRRLIP